MPEALEKNTTSAIPKPMPPKNGFVRYTHSDGVSELINPTGTVYKTESASAEVIPDFAKEAALKFLGNTPKAGTVAERISDAERETVADLYEKLEADLMNTVSFDDYEKGKRPIDEAAQKEFSESQLQTLDTLFNISLALGTQPGKTNIFEFIPGITIENQGGHADINITNELRYIAYEHRGDDGKLKALILERSSEKQGNAAFVLRNDNGELEHSSVLTRLFDEKMSRAELRSGTYADEETGEEHRNPQRPVNHDYYDYVNDEPHLNPQKYQRFLDRITFWATCPMDKFLHGNQSVPKSFGRLAASSTGTVPTP